MKISILLPYKENFSIEKSGAVSLFVNDIIKNRLLKHNTNNGAKSTRGRKWVVIYKRYFKSKSAAMSYEYKLKPSSYIW